ncbi:MAG: glutamate--tRNA ligase [Anaerolineales bacterium]|nr:glutamate--tRNA ligase [Anaerolineales bacterium]
MASVSEPVRVRFAPSPTGRTHLGSGRTALFNFLLARQTGGEFILRIEDTDRKRYQADAERELLESLRWLGLHWDEGPDVGGPHAPYHQSQRGEIYLNYALQLVERGHAYPCFCSPQRLTELRQQQASRKESQRYDGLCRQLPPPEAQARIRAGESYVIRFKIPGSGSITVRDHLRGNITVQNQNIDDYILVKSDGLALYHLAAMVDDHLMKVTHVIRGSEWLPTFPLHAHIIRAFGWEEPIWTHLSIFLKPSGKGKMSKRDAANLMKDGFSIYLLDLREMGYIPEAVVNWIALMGWGYDDHTEFFTIDDLIEKFSLERLNPAPAAINISKLDHFNGMHIRRLELADLAQRVKPYFEAAGYQVDDERLLEIAPLIQERLPTLDDAPRIAGFFFDEDVNPDPPELVGKNMTAAESLAAVQRAYQVLSELAEFSSEAVDEPLRNLAEQLDLKAAQLLGILRVAITGQRVSPPLFETISVLGREVVLRRLKEATALLQDMHAD